jgi:hypothetical protein
MRARAGIAVTELVVTLAITAILAAGLGSVLLTHLRVTRMVAARVAAADAIRLAVHALPTELRLALLPADIHGFSATSVAFRLPRLSGTVCARAVDRVWLRLSGMRVPDPVKDSVLFISAAGESALALAGLSEDPARCAGRPGSGTYRLDAPADTQAAALLVFESGTYYLRDRALRFRIGAEGRQPLTEEVFLDAGSHFSLHFDSAWSSFDLRLSPRPAFGRQLTAPATAGFSLPNNVPAQ